MLYKYYTGSDCPPPPPVSKAELQDEFRNVSVFHHGDKVRYICAKFHELRRSDSLARTCEDGKWSAVQFECGSKIFIVLETLLF